VVSQPRIIPEGKAQADSQAQQPRQYVSISRGLQSACGGPSGVRRGYETTYNNRLHFSMNVNEKTIWVTGASSGIGRAVSVNLSRRGARVILSDRQATGETF